MEICLDPPALVLSQPLTRLPEFPGAEVCGLLLAAFIWFENDTCRQQWLETHLAERVRWCGTLQELSEGHSPFAREFRLGFREQQPGPDSDAPITAAEWPDFCRALGRYGRC